MQRKYIMAKLKSRGQGMVEYIIIVALIGIAAIATYTYFGQTVRNQTAGITQELSGNSGQNAITAAGTSAGQAATEGTTTRGLNNYNSGVQNP